MARRNLNLSERHDKLLCGLAKKLGVTMSETMQRALEALEEKEARRVKEVASES